MSQPASSSKKIVIALAALLAAGLGAYYVTLQPAQAPAKSAAPALQTGTSRTKEQASMALMALPELKAWSSQLEKNSAGKVHGALIEYDPKPRIVNGKSYWQFSFVGNGATAINHLESFLVAASGKEILIEDPATDELLSLERWRKEKHPMTRIVGATDGG